MHGSAMSGWLLMALCVAAGGYCLLRMRGVSRRARAAAGSEALMGFGMAAMALPAVVAAPPEWGWTVLAAVFAVSGLRALWRLRKGARHLHHLVGSLAMVYMALTMTSGMAGGADGGAMAPMAPMAHTAHPAGGVPLITGALLVYYAGYILRAGAALVPAPAPAAAAAGAGGGAGGWGARPELTLACRLAMGTAMFAMLLTV
ncbi:DUF5134 domain-containing protein [Streptomyces sp. NPDC059398]|uniref:DUF5134 domain-containing protein n=1 Tax=Streptomyces sp. NPDC059398 TaxID=3346820 RepID=UPI0036952944